MLEVTFHADKGGHISQVVNHYQVTLCHLLVRLLNTTIVGKTPSVKQFSEIGSMNIGAVIQWAQILSLNYICAIKVID